MNILTDEEIDNISKKYAKPLGGDHWNHGTDGIEYNGYDNEDFARAIEKAVVEKLILAMDVAGSWSHAREVMQSMIEDGK